MPTGMLMSKVMHIIMLMYKVMLNAVCKFKNMDGSG